MKRFSFIYVLALLTLSPCIAQENAGKSKLTTITKKEFKQKIWDSSKDKNFKYTGDKPIIIDFNATWCKPCKKIHPILEELQYEYGDKVTIYSIDIDEESNKTPDYPTIFKFDKIPTILLIKAGSNKKPIPISIGGYTKEQLKELIDIRLFDKNIE